MQTNPPAVRHFTVTLRTVLPLLLLGVLTQITSPVTAQRYELVWQDEFDGDTLDPLWIPWKGTAYNNELQCYTGNPGNLFLRDGHLHLQALRETRTCGSRTTQYSSARVSTDSTRMGWAYGRFEARIKMPAGQGFWPAFWLMPTRNIGWPRGGEIDIMEYRGNLPQETNAAIHYWRQGCTGNPVQCRNFLHKTYPTPFDLSLDFHIYALRWTPEVLQWYFNDILYYEVHRSAISADFDPFTGPFYIILNLAVGGDYLPNPDINTPFPQALVIDYVRVYQDTNQPPDFRLEHEAHLDLPAGTPLPLNIRADDTDGNIVKVVLTRDDQEIAVLEQAPFTYTLPALMEGCYTLGGYAIDNDGARSAPLDPITLTVGHGCDETPWNSTAFALPGTIPAWQYNRGGQHRGYFETQPQLNLGAIDHPTMPRRHEAVDLRPTERPSAAYTVFNMVTNEWLSFDTIIAADSLFTFSLEVSTEVSSSVDLYHDEILLLSINRMRTEGEWQTYQSEPVHLPAGATRLRIQVRTGNLSLSTITVHAVEPTSVVRPETTSLPDQPQLGIPYPNPFNPVTMIPVRNTISSEVRLRVFDTAGRLVEILHDGPLHAGHHNFVVNMYRRSSGRYMVVLEADQDRQVRPITLLK